MDKILRYASTIPHDKLLHAFYGSLVYSLLIFIVSSDTAVASVIFIAFAKEAYDEYKYKGADVWDYLATIAIPILLHTKTLI